MLPSKNRAGISRLAQPNFGAIAEFRRVVRDQRAAVDQSDGGDLEVIRPDGGAEGFEMASEHGEAIRYREASART